MEDLEKSKLELYQKLQDLINENSSNISEFEKVTNMIKNIGTEDDKAI